MRVETLQVKGYRSLEDVALRFTDLTAFIGPNGSGKSSILGALRLFFEPSSSVGTLDFWSGPGQTTDTISILITIGDMDEAKRQEGHVPIRGV
jgi:putative ATP-dependent endonuclease of the OLD family